MPKYTRVPGPVKSYLGLAGGRRLERLSAETGAKGHFLRLDLSDLRSVAATVDALGRLSGGRKVDPLVANAGMVPREYGTSPQGHELAFATNTLGHHLLLRRLLERGWLGARAVLLTGDIYILARDCTPDFRYRGLPGALVAYSRSKLGTLWEARELQRRHPELEVVVVHPGVVATALVEAGAALQRRLFIDTVAGAQTPLVAATQPGLRGAYLHNTLGRVELADDDPALDAGKAAVLWDLMERLCAPF